MYLNEIVIHKFLQTGECIIDRKTFLFAHELEGLMFFLRYARAVESFTELRPAVVLEATGSYHSLVVQFLDKY